MTRALRGATSPLRRDRKHDFASATGAALQKSKALQALATDPGELWWRTEFGSGLNRLRHRENDEVTGELARIYTRDALRAWIPSMRLREFELPQTDTRLRVSLTVDTDDDPVPTSIEGGL